MCSPPQEVHVLLLGALRVAAYCPACYCAVLSHGGISPVWSTRVVIAYMFKPVECPAVTCVKVYTTSSMVQLVTVVMHAGTMENLGCSLNAPPSVPLHILRVDSIFEVWVSRSVVRYVLGKDVLFFSLRSS